MSEADLDTWYSLALPIMGWVAEIEGQTIQVTSGEIAGRFDVGDRAAEVELKRLIEGGWIDALDTTGYGGGLSLMEPRLTEKGARAVGRWPSNDPYEALMAVLESRIVDPDIDATTRSRLVRFRDGLVDVGKGMVSGVLSTVLTTGFPS